MSGFFTLLVSVLVLLVITTYTSRIKERVTHSWGRVSEWERTKHLDWCYNFFSQHFNILYRNSIHSRVMNAMSANALSCSLSLSCSYFDCALVFMHVNYKYIYSKPETRVRREKSRRIHLHLGVMYMYPCCAHNEHSQFDSHNCECSPFKLLPNNRKLKALNI